MVVRIFAAIVTAITGIAIVPVLAFGPDMITAILFVGFGLEVCVMAGWSKRAPAA